MHGVTDFVRVNGVVKVEIRRVRQVVRRNHQFMLRVAQIAITEHGSIVLQGKGALIRLVIEVSHELAIEGKITLRI